MSVAADMHPGGQGHSFAAATAQLWQQRAPLVVVAKYRQGDGPRCPCVCLGTCLCIDTTNVVASEVRKIAAIVYVSRPCQNSLVTRSSFPKTSR